MNPYDAILGEMPLRHGLPRPDWDAVYNRWEALPLAEQAAAWSHVERSWQHALAAAWGEPFRVIEYAHHLLTTDLPDPEAQHTLRFMVRSLGTINQMLRSIGLNASAGPSSCEDTAGFDIVIACRTTERYLDYICDEYPEDHRGGVCSGVCLHRGATHVAIHGKNPPEFEATLAHELAHTCLAGYPMPLWLNEGLVTLLESAVTGTDHFDFQYHDLEHHRAFWTPERLEGFFFDDSLFASVEDGFSLSYVLAKTIARNLLELDRKELGRFASTASYEDGGEAACRTVYDCDLFALLPRFAR